MKSAEQWIANVAKMRGFMVESTVREIQADALRHAAEVLRPDWEAYQDAGEGIHKLETEADALDPQPKEAA